MKEITLKLDRYEAQNLLTNIKFFIEYFEEDCDNNNWEAMYMVLQLEEEKALKNESSSSKKEVSND